MDYPEIRVDTDREKAGLVGVTARDAAQATLEATLGNINTPSVWIDPNNGQSYYVVTYYDGAAVADSSALARAPGAHRRRRQGRCALGAYGDDPPLGRARSPSSATSSQRAAHVLMQTEGRDIGSVAADLERALARRPAHARTSSSSSSARSS